MGDSKSIQVVTDKGVITLNSKCKVNISGPNVSVRQIGYNVASARHSESGTILEKTQPTYCDNSKLSSQKSKNVNSSRDESENLVSAIKQRNVTLETKNRKLHEKLSGYYADHKENSHLKDKIKELEENLKKKNTENLNITQSFAQEKRSLENKNRKFENNLQKFDLIDSTTQKQLEDKERIIQDNEKTIQDKDRLISHLEGTLNEITKSFPEARSDQEEKSEKELKQLRSYVSKLEKEITESAASFKGSRLRSDREIDESCKTIKEKEKILSDIRVKISELERKLAESVKSFEVSRITSERHLKQCYKENNDKEQELKEIRGNELKLESKLTESTKSFEEFKSRSDRDLEQNYKELAKKNREITDMKLLLEERKTSECQELKAREILEQTLRDRVGSLEKALLESEATNETNLQHKVNELAKVHALLRQEEGLNETLKMQIKTIEATVNGIKAVKHEDLNSYNKNLKREQEANTGLKLQVAVLNERIGDFEKSNEALNVDLSAACNVVRSNQEVTDTLKANNIDLCRHIEALEKALQEKNAECAQVLIINQSKMSDIQEKLQCGRVTDDREKICGDCKILQNSIHELQKQIKDNRPDVLSARFSQSEKMRGEEKKWAEQTIREQRQTQEKLWTQKLRELQKKSELRIKQESDAKHVTAKQLADAIDKTISLEKSITMLKKRSACTCAGSMDDRIAAVMNEKYSLEEKVKKLQGEKQVLLDKLGESQRCMMQEHIERTKLRKTSCPPSATSLLQ